MTANLSAGAESDRDHRARSVYASEVVDRRSMAPESVDRLRITFFERDHLHARESRSDHPEGADLGR
jgi:hypothetical protein